MALPRPNKLTAYEEAVTDLDFFLYFRHSVPSTHSTRSVPCQIHYFFNATVDYLKAQYDTPHQISTHVESGDLQGSAQGLEIKVYAHYIEIAQVYVHYLEYRGINLRRILLQAGNVALKPAQKQVRDETLGFSCRGDAHGTAYCCRVRIHSMNLPL